MSEAACAVVLEAAPTEPAGVSRPASGVAPVYVEDFALGGDATHLTGADPEGRLLTNINTPDDYARVRPR